MIVEASIFLGLQVVMIEFPKPPPCTQVVLGDDARGFLESTDPVICSPANMLMPCVSKQFIVSRTVEKCKSWVGLKDDGPLQNFFKLKHQALNLAHS